MESLDSPFEKKLFLEIFLTPREREVFAKRLAVAILILKGYEYKKIEKEINVGPTTISKIHQLLVSQPELARAIYLIFIYPQEEDERQKKIDKKMAADCFRPVSHPQVDRILEQLGILSAEEKK
ncbi:hypothetical protein KBI33_00915 [Candidatus Shapirobacteria bacterium]|nr:hypothetical protein [Candidatus Shapirobacteria bacterium]